MNIILFYAHEYLLITISIKHTTIPIYVLTIQMLSFNYRNMLLTTIKHKNVANALQD